ncbi:8428_t:CDS:1, partial [Paraglomus occultum]
AMNTQVCTATKRTPYERVYGQEPRSGFALMKELYDQGIRDEEDIPDNVTAKL